MAQIEEANERSMPLQSEQAGTRLQRPYLNHVVHGATDATVAAMIENNAVDLL